METALPQLRRGAEPFLLEGGGVGCVCVHGFTASPEEMRWLGEYLHARGLTICAPRLAGHGTSPAMMRRQHWMDWYESVLDGIALARARCRKVFAVGLSMGGLLSLRVAAAGLVDGAVVMAAPLYVDAPLRLASVLKYVRPYRVPRRGDLDARVRAAQHQMGREDYGRVAYDDGTPVASIAQLRALMGEVRRHLPEITVPLLLIYSKADQTVPFGNMQVVAEQVRRADLVQKTLERSDHVLTQEIEREAVYEMVWEFLSARLE
jgi:carboxylesterase